MRFARDQIQTQRPVQGNLDPLALLVGGEALDRAVDAILEAFAARPFIFNLGHGVLPETPIAHVERLIARVRGMTGGSDACQLEDAKAMTMIYAWLKAFHIIAVIAWMAGMLYLPRLFVYHCAAEKGSVQSETFKVMERRLLRAIINPAMIATWVLGLWLAWLGLILATAGSLRAGCRPRSCSSSRCRRCTDCSPAGSRILPPTATGIRRDSIELSTKYRRS